MAITFHYKFSNTITLECEMEYEGEERESFDCPGSASNAYVLNAKFNDVDISDIICESVFDRIVEKFLEEYENQEDQYEPDYESMLDKD